MEGNTLVLREVEALLDSGRAVGAKSLKEYNEVRGYAEAAKWVYGQALEPAEWHDGRLLTIGEVPAGAPHGDDARVGCRPTSGSDGA